MNTKSSLALLVLLALPFGVRSATFTVTNTAAGGPGSLPQAMMDANAAPGGDTIAFNIAAGGLTIAPSNALPVITDPVTIDGTTQPGYSSAPLIEITGTNAGNFVNGLVIATNNCIIRALAINQFRGDNYLSGDAIQITNGTGSRVEGCYLGIARDGVTRAGNAGAGVRIGHWNYYSPTVTAGNVIGGTATAAPNLISANRYGIYIVGSPDNSIWGNKIGTDLAGSFGVGNTNGGIFVYSALATGNFIGGTNAGQRNLISGNGDIFYYSADGVMFSGASSNSVFGNFIGVDATGTYPIPNTQHGVNIQYGSANLIGGSSTGQSNLISGNLQNGVNLGGFGEAVAAYSGTPPPLPEGNIVQGNLIGTDITGQLALGNQNDGVFIANMQGNLVGGFSAGERNVISGNRNNGVEITSYSTRFNQIAGNFIGITLTGALPLGNQASGVSVSSDDNIIGGTNAGAGNLIANNNSIGVQVSYGVGVAILGNSIYGNTNLGIDLAADGVTLNDEGDGDTGANNLQNFPVLAKPIKLATTTLIAGTLNSLTNSPYRIELFHDPARDPSGYGEGKNYLGYVAVLTDGAGNAGFSFTNPVSLPFGDFITATATSTNGDTSEFSLARRVVTPDSVDLVLTKTDSADPAPRSSSFFYTITVTNFGPASASSVVVTDSLPAGLSYVGATSSQGSCSQSAGVVTCNLGTLANGAGAGILITVNGTNTGQVFNSATASASQLENEPEDNSVVESTLVGIADTAVRIIDSPSPVVAGQVLTYSVIVSNLGPDAATSTTLSFNVDYGNFITGASVSQGTLTQLGNSFSAALGTIPAYGIATLTVTAIPTTLGTIYDYATGFGSEADTNMVNNSANITTAVLAGSGILEFTSHAYGTNESAGAAIISVQRLGGAIGTVSADFATSNLTATAGSDYTATNGTLTFTNGELFKSFLVKITDDLLPECNEDVRVRLFNPAGGAVLLPPTNSVLHLFDNELSPAGTVQGVSLALTNVATTGNSGSSEVSISDDGRYVAFSSFANNLVTTAGPSFTSDIFIHDRVTQSNTLISLNAQNTAANDASSAPQISADGSRIGFNSSASDLTTNVLTALQQVYVRTLASGVNQLVSVSTNGSGGNNSSGSFTPSLSTNGMKLAYLSSANNLVAGVADGSGSSDVFFRDLAADTNILVSINPAGNAAGNGTSSARPVISADGRYVVFATYANNLTPGDGNSRADIYRRDVVAGVTALVSANTNGVAGNNSSDQHYAVSGDGRYVAFESSATDLAPGTPAFSQQIFWRDMSSGTNLLVSVNNFGVAANNYANFGGMSRDGRYVLFDTAASNISSNDFNSTFDVFVRDVVAGATYLVSVNRTNNGTGNSASSISSFLPSVSSLSPDGRYVTFASVASDLVAASGPAFSSQFYERDLLNNTTTLLTTRLGDTNGADSGRYDSAVSANGVAAFSSYATDLALDVNGNLDVFARAPGASAPELVSKAIGLTANSSSQDAHISANGAKVVYTSFASNLFPNDTNYASDVFIRDVASGTNDLVSVNAANNGSGGWAADQPCLGSDGRYVAYRAVGNSTSDIYLRDTIAKTNLLVSVNQTGNGGGNDYSHDPEITPDGKFIVFGSTATNLVANDGNGNVSDVFIRNRTNSAVELVSRNAAGTGSANDGSNFPTVSDDGRYVAFESLAGNLGPADSNNHLDIYVRDRQTGSNILCSPKLGGGNGGNADSYAALISGNGRYVTFNSNASDLVGGDTNLTTDVFVFDINTRTLQLVSRTAGGIPGNGYSANPSISADGRYIAFESTATNLVANDSNGDFNDVFVRDTVAGTTALVSVNCAGTGSGNDNSYTPRISGDGRFIAFVTYASDLVPGDFSASLGNILRRDLLAGTTALVSQNRTLLGGGNLPSFDPSISFSGGTIAFASSASDLIFGDANTTEDIFVWNAAIGGGSIDLALSKTVSTGTVAQGAGFAYTLTITNYGIAIASNVVVTDALPASVSYLTANSSQGTVANNAGLVTASAGTLNPGAGFSITINVTATTAGYVTNTAITAANTTDLNSPNNLSSVVVLVTAPAAPPLSIVPTNGNQIFLSWPYPSSGYGLETTTNIAPISVWTAVSNLVSNNGLINFLLLNVNATEPARFYRLRHP